MNITQSAITTTIARLGIPGYDAWFSMPPNGLNGRPSGVSRENAAGQRDGEPKAKRRRVDGSGNGETVSGNGEGSVRNGGAGGVDIASSAAQVGGMSAASGASNDRIKILMRETLLPAIERKLQPLKLSDQPRKYLATSTLTAIAGMPWFHNTLRTAPEPLSDELKAKVSELAAFHIQRLLRENPQLLLGSPSAASGPPSSAVSPSTTHVKSTPRTREGTIASEATPAPLQNPAGGSSRPSAVPVDDSRASTRTPSTRQPSNSALPRGSWPSDWQASLEKSGFGDAAHFDLVQREQWRRKHQLQQTAGPLPTWVNISHRPYRAAAERHAITNGSRHLVPKSLVSEEGPTVFHVDFTASEVEGIMKVLSAYTRTPHSHFDLETLATICKSAHNLPIPSLVALPYRSAEDVRNFCSDLMAGQARRSGQDGQVLSLQKGETQDRQKFRHRQSSRISSLLFAREVSGEMGFGQCQSRQLINLRHEFKKSREDALTLVAEYTNCAGDISAISWVSDDNFICGTTAHSDPHNQQYNKPGNLLLCSTSQGTLKAFPDHRVPRPRVEKGDNSTEAMRLSQDPWLYSSVVSSDYDDDRAYTSSFDKTVKVWKVDKHGKAMDAIATWHHAGNVNFVAAAKDHSGRVATASDVPSEAVRVYTVDEANVDASEYYTLSCTRTDAEGSDKWAYYPATMQWGCTPDTAHLLVVGYSPRSLAGDDYDIPEDKKNTGEITLWDARRRCRAPVLTASTANVFEVAWHPRLSRFIVATSPCGISVDPWTRTQIHIFQQDRDRTDGAYYEYQSLDCNASDINELTIMPNSQLHAYVTAACTDGRVYVWDTAQGDQPIHALKHGRPLDEYSGDREKEDTGVKFTAWGDSPDRLYTGGSDGAVKVWNVRNQRKPYVRTLMDAPGPISCGVFSPGRSRLAVGDATGRVFVLSLDEEDEHDSHFTTLPLPGSRRRMRRPQPYIPHPDPPAPAPALHDQSELGRDAMEVDEALEDSSITAYTRRTYLATDQLKVTSNPVIGAVQGPSYALTNFYRKEAHLDDDPSLPLLPYYERLQLASIHSSKGERRRSLRRLPQDVAESQDFAARHGRNVRLDLDVDALSNGVRETLITDGVVLDMEGEEGWDLEYEEMPSDM